MTVYALLNAVQNMPDNTVVCFHVAVDGVPGSRDFMCNGDVSVRPVEFDGIQRPCVVFDLIPDRREINQLLMVDEEADYSGTKGCDNS